MRQLGTSSSRMGRRVPWALYRELATIALISLQLCLFWANIARASQYIPANILNWNRAS